MKTALKTITNIQPTIQSDPEPGRLVTIKFKDYSLLGLRDHQLEKLAQAQLQSISAISSHFKLPKLYTLISQNRKVPLDEKLSSDSRIFINFESYKWSEPYFHYFRKITHAETNQFIFNNLLYKLDAYITYFHLSILAVTDKKYNFDWQDPLQRLHAQVRLIRTLQQHEHSSYMLIFLIYDLLMVALKQPDYSMTSQFISSTEAILLLNHFGAKKLIQLRNNQICYHPQNLQSVLSDYLLRNGRILISGSAKEMFTSQRMFLLNQLAQNTPPILKMRNFETCFSHQ